MHLVLVTLWRMTTLIKGERATCRSVKKRHFFYAGMFLNKEYTVMQTERWIA